MVGALWMAQEISKVRGLALEGVRGREGCEVAWEGAGVGAREDAGGRGRARESAGGRGRVREGVGGRGRGGEGAGGR